MNVQRSVAKNTVVKCASCHGYYRMPAPVVSGMLPVTVICPVCLKKEVWKFIPVLPKMAMDCHVYATLLGKEELQEAAKEEGEEEKEPPLKLPLATSSQTKLPFSEFQRELQRRMAATLATVKDLRIALAELAHQFTLDCRQELEVLYDLRCWDEMLCEFFFRHPFCVLPFPCRSDGQSQYARYILAPRFFIAPWYYRVSLDSVPAEVAGIPAGGMNLGVVNIYSLANGIPIGIKKVLALPKLPQLAVYGRKIVGADLPWLWQEIPGVTTDHDHTAESPSIVIGIDGKARLWLAQHGIRAWSDSPIAKEECNNRHLFQTFFQDNPSLAVWDDFIAHGRLILFCQCSAKIRSTAMAIAYLLRGIKGVFCASQDQKEAWRKSYISHSMDITNVIFCLSDDYENMDVKIHACSAIFVDASLIDESILALLRRLLKYDGHVFIITEDPLMDFDEDDEIAALVHAVGGFTHQMPALDKDEKYFSRISQPLQTESKFKWLFKSLKRQHQGNRQQTKDD